MVGALQKMNADAEGLGSYSEDARSLEQIWAAIRGRLRQEAGEAAYRSWLRELALGWVRGPKVRLTVPSRFMRDWIAGNYGEALLRIWQEELPEVEAVDVVVTPRAPAAPMAGAGQVPHTPIVRDDFNYVPPQAKELDGVNGSTAAAKVVKENGFSTAPGPSELRAIEAYGGPLDPRFTFDAFVVGKSNELAYAAARRVGEAGQPPFNPLFLYGGVGLGKTHLMHAIAWQIQRAQPSKRVIYLSAEQFMYQFVRAVRTKDTMAFKEMFRSVDVLMIDDVQFIGGREATQEEFFHTFNALVDQNRQVVISADKSPSDLEGVEERMRSRLGWGLVADIHPTTYELRLSILQAKVERSGVEVPPKVLEFLAHKITSNVRELEGALTRIIAHASLVGRPITLEAAQELLLDLLRACDRRVTIEEIQKKVAEHFNIRVADMHSARRARAVARPRQVAMYLSKQLTARSLPEIGRRFGGRDHTTVMHAVRKIEELIALDSGFAEDVELLRRMLET